MPDPSVYDPGSRELQDRFDSRRIADRLAEVSYRAEFGDADRKLIESAPMFFLATADASGRPDCSYKGGLPGFVRVTAPAELAWPDYDGNGQFRSLGNVRGNPHVGLLFIDWKAPRRLRVNGEATVSDADPLLAECEGAQLIVRVRVRHIFPNCPRYIALRPAAGLRAPAPRLEGRSEVQRRAATKGPEAVSQPSASVRSDEGRCRRLTLSLARSAGDREGV